MKVVVQEIIYKFLNLAHVLQEGQNNIVHGNITVFKDIKKLALLNNASIKTH